ncbi:sensor domain-containing diguanylate cyclase [Sesbania bispinosa]|nr:sensor domain-containing diguanylate cyclase [Sesbania bispinosa]
MTSVQTSFTFNHPFTDVADHAFWFLLVVARHPSCSATARPNRNKGGTLNVVQNVENLGKC